MVKINSNTVNNDNWKAATTETSAADSSKEDLQNRIDEALEQINQVESEWDEYMTDEQRAEMERIKATLMAQDAALENNEYFDANNPGTGTADETQYVTSESLADLGTGWNGGLISNYADDAAILTADDGEYMGTVEIESSGDPSNPTKLGFSVNDELEKELMGEGGSIEKVEVSSRGRDLVYTVIGKDKDGNEVRKSWVVKEGTVRPEPMIINCTGLSHAITIDCSQAYRVSDGSYNSYYGVSRGFYIHGTSGNDTIYGSQGDDKIVAWEGDDYIDGMAGNDTVWGDEYYEAGGSFSENGGRDTIRGGAGSDTMYGGGNIDTRFRSDNASVNNPEATYEFENVADDVSGAIPETSNWVQTDWDVSEEDGMVVLEQGAELEGGGEIHINMPEGYNMAFAEVGPDGKSLVITFVGEDANGNPITFQMKIKDFMQGSTGLSPEDVIKLNFTGSDSSDIIDFHKVMGLTNQIVNISGGAGDDIILGATNELLSQGIAYDDLLESSVSGSALNNYVTEGVVYEDSEDPSGYVARYDSASGRIIISDDPISTENHEAIRIMAPEGFETGYVATDPYSGNMLVILVNPTTKETIVIEIDSSAGALDHNDIIVGTRTASEFDETGDYDADWAEGFQEWPGLTPISLDPNDYTINGGEGRDLGFAPKGTKFTDVEDEIEGNFEDGAGLNEVPATPVETNTETETESESESE